MYLTTEGSSFRSLTSTGCCILGPRRGKSIQFKVATERSRRWNELSRNANPDEGRTETARSDFERTTTFGKLGRPSAASSGASRQNPKKKPGGRCERRSRRRKRASTSTLAG